MNTDSPNTSELLKRNLDYWQTGRGWVGNVDDRNIPAIFHGLNAERQIDYCSFDFAVAEHSPFIQFGWPHDTEQLGQCDWAIVIWPRDKSSRDLWLKLAAAQLKPQGRLYVVGALNAGGKSAAKALTALLGKHCKLDAARHCVLFAADTPSIQPMPDLEALTTHWHNVDKTGLRTVVQLPGVFSQGRLDDGTDLLLEQLPPLQGTVLDMACGNGVIACHIKQKHLAEVQVTAVDTYALAVIATQRTAAENGLELNDVLASNMFSQLAGKFDFIVSNPPFHAGVNTHYAATERFLMQAGDYLSPKGQLIIVANAFLKYTPLMERHIGPVSILADNKRFRVYAASKA